MYERWACENLTSRPLSCSFCSTNESALALSASESEIWFKGFDGRAGQRDYVSTPLNT